MALHLYNEEDNEFTSSNPIRFRGDGHLGGSHIVLCKIKNDDVTDYYTDLKAWIETDVGEDAWGEIGESGWSHKIISAETEPLESDFDSVMSGAECDIEDIGDNSLGDDTSYRYLYIRVYIPGSTPAQWRNYYKLRLKGLVRKVGS
jgi:hypothetical protein